MFWFLWTIRWDTDYHMMNTVEYTCSDTYVHMWKYDWPFKVKGKLHWLFCSATVVVAEMLAERELSGPVYHWNGFGQWGKRLRPFKVRHYAALYLKWNRCKVCKTKELQIPLYFSQTKNYVEFYMYQKDFILHIKIYFVHNCFV